MKEQPGKQEQEDRQAQIMISNRISVAFFGLIATLSLLTALAFALTSGTATTRMPMRLATPAAQTVTVAMRDPGCHWFQTAQGYQKSMSVTGPVNLVNSDEAALRIAGAHGVRTDGVGRQVSLAPGSYTITMVGQAPDDNTLHLTVS
jgi:hypothetical protein